MSPDLHPGDNCLKFEGKVRTRDTGEGVIHKWMVCD